jgi:hypothetical protein
VPGVGFEPTSPRFRRGAFTRLASQANWRGRGESNSFRRSGAPALNQSTTSAWCAPEDSNLSSANLPVSQTPVLQTGGRRGTRMSCRRSRSCLRGGHRAKAKWRKVKESNPRPRGRPGFRDRLRATTRHLPRWLSRRDLNARPPPSDDGALIH